MRRENALPHLAEVFREYGYEGASIALISKATALGKGSLYNFFPAGKSEMLSATLAEIDTWFDANIFLPLTVATNAEHAIISMFEAVTRYFNSGQRVCLVGAVSISIARDTFGEALASYFLRWVEALADCLSKGGLTSLAALSFAEDAVASIQGAIVLSRAVNDPSMFARVIATHKCRLVNALKLAHDVSGREL
jgi:TetR/AcrR family transcriptional regulator, lmrAB and yxaGH operons repressor